MKAYEGKTVQVLADGPSKRNPAVLSGYTETNKLVNFTGDGVKAGDIVPVFIETAKTFSWTAIWSRIRRQTEAGPPDAAAAGMPGSDRSARRDLSIGRLFIPGQARGEMAGADGL